MLSGRENTGSRILAALLCLVLLAGCGAAPQAEPTAAPEPSASSGGTLTVAVEAVTSGAPLYPQSSGDETLRALTQLSLVTVDQSGLPVEQEASGEADPYEVPAVLRLEQEAETLRCYLTLREGLTFSDGTPVTADDVIFTLYLLCDPAYDGPFSLGGAPIRGLAEYRAGMTARSELLLSGGDGGCTPEQQERFWTAYRAAGARFAGEIVDYCARQGYGETVWEAAAAWGYDGLDESARAGDFFDRITDRLGYDPAALDAESAGSSFAALLREELGEDANFFSAFVETGASVSSVSGIEKTGETSLCITLTETDLSFLTALQVPILPLHYYGSRDLYDPAESRFGFPKGDLTLIRARDNAPLGAGVYRVTELSGGSAVLEANPAYYRGTPGIQTVRLLAAEDPAAAVAAGKAALAEVPLTAGTAARSEGDGVQALPVEGLGYGYVGCSANRVHVGRLAGTDRSKSLRRAFAVVFSLYREESAAACYGIWAEPADYPLAESSWLAPLPEEAGYCAAFSTDAEGNPLYTAEMTEQEREQAVKAEALRCLAAAGYTLEQGYVTEAPSGGRLKYSVWLPAEQEDAAHPMALLCRKSAQLLASLGITLEVRSVTEQELWSALAEEGVDFWCAAWETGNDPEFQRLYTREGAYGYLYDLDDAELERLLQDAQRTRSVPFRRAMVRTALERVLDWAVEVPVYQRRALLLYDPEQVDASTLPEPLTAARGWEEEIYRLRLK